MLVEVVDVVVVASTFPKYHAPVRTPTDSGAK